MLSNQQIETFVYEHRSNINRLTIQLQGLASTVLQLSGNASSKVSTNSITGLAINSIVLSGISGFVQGAVLFMGTNGVIQQDPTNFSWDSSVHVLSISGILLSSLTASSPVLSDGSKNLISGKIDLSSSSYIVNTLGVANGGTGATSLTAYGVLIGNGTGAIAIASPGTSGLPLVSNGILTNPSFQALSSLSATIVLAKLTGGGSNGSITVVNGIVTAYTAPT
jgi:hypothetical protein